MKSLVEDSEMQVSAGCKMCYVVTEASADWTQIQIPPFLFSFFSLFLNNSLSFALLWIIRLHHRVTCFQMTLKKNLYSPENMGTKNHFLMLLWLMACALRCSWDTRLENESLMEICGWCYCQRRNGLWLGHNRQLIHGLQLMHVGLCVWISFFSFHEKWNHWVLTDGWTGINSHRAPFPH